MLTSYEICVGEGKFTLRAIVVKTHNGVDIYVGGGEKTHIGAVVLCLPRLSLLDNETISCTTSVINILGHKDDKIAIPIAEEVCKEINQVVVVTAGIHIDNANIDEIKILMSLVQDLVSLILEGLKIDNKI